jgi:hypothetical protein
MPFARPKPGTEEDWDEFLGENAHIKCACELQVLALADIAAMPIDGSIAPYTRLYQACEQLGERQLNALMMTDMMSIITEFKWHAYCKHRVRWRVGLYLLHFMLAACTFLMSSQYADRIASFHSAGGWAGCDWSDALDALPMACDALAAGTLVTNSVVCFHELTQVKLTLDDLRHASPQVKATGTGQSPSCCLALQLHFASFWNYVDLAGILALYGAAVGHLIDNAALVQELGALGVLLNGFSFLQLLQVRKRYFLSVFFNIKTIILPRQSGQT